MQQDRCVVCYRAGQLYRAAPGSGREDRPGSTYGGAGLARARVVPTHTEMPQIRPASTDKTDRPGRTRGQRPSGSRRSAPASATAPAETGRRRSNCCLLTCGGVAGVHRSRAGASQARGPHARPDRWPWTGQRSVVSGQQPVYQVTHPLTASLTAPRFCETYCDQFRMLIHFTSVAK